MLKYLYCKELFSEIPGEISLGISISGCQIRCSGCHSRELWEDKGTPLNVQSVATLLQQHKGITCLLLLGGEHNIPALMEIFQYAHQKTKTAWYCGLDILPKEHQSIIQHLNFLKLGHYDQRYGGLDQTTTNQHLYSIEHQEDGNYRKSDITHLLQRKTNQYQKIKENDN